MRTVGDQQHHVRITSSAKSELGALSLVRERVAMSRALAGKSAPRRAYFARRIT
jgi:hypothetical protein